MVSLLRFSSFIYFPSFSPLSSALLFASFFLCIHSVTHVWGLFRVQCLGHTHFNLSSDSLRVVEGAGGKHIWKWWLLYPSSHFRCWSDQEASSYFSTHSSLIIPIGPEMSALLPSVSWLGHLLTVFFSKLSEPAFCLCFIFTIRTVRIRITHWVSTGTILQPVNMWALPLGLRPDMTIPRRMFLFVCLFFSSCPMLQ